MPVSVKDRVGCDVPVAPSRIHAYRNQLRAELETPPAGIAADELDAHFNGMPDRYWERLTESELIWGLNMIHCFLEKLAAPEGAVTTPVVGWRHFPARGFSKVMLCTWDRYGLLAKAAAAFSSVGVNIIQADVYTRADHVVLDVFRVCDAQRRPIRDRALFHQMLFLLEGALSDPPRFASMWAGNHKIPPDTALPPKVSFDNLSVPGYTVMTVEASDRLGLLHDILRALADCALDVAQALIDTSDQVARDIFHITDLNGSPIAHQSQIGFIRDRVLAAIA